jgi:putative transposase
VKRIYVLFFISLASRWIEFVVCSPNPTGAWTAQQARNLLMGERRSRAAAALPYSRS